MKALVSRLYHLFDREVIERQIEEELRLHLDLLTEQNLQQNMSPAEANDAALERFGNVEQIKAQCVEISRNSRPLVRILKSSLILVFVIGVVIRVFGAEISVTRVGNILMFIALLGRLFFYVRSLDPSRFTPRHVLSSPLRLNQGGLNSFTAYDQSGRTPLERVLSDS